MKRRRAVLPVTEDGVPVELLDADHPVWTSAASCREWLNAHGLEETALSVADRMLGGHTHPHNRRNHAAAAWGAANAIASAPGRGDWNRLRQMGLIT